MPIACWILSLTTIINSWYYRMARKFYMELNFTGVGRTVKLTFTIVLQRYRTARKFRGLKVSWIA